MGNVDHTETPAVESVPVPASDDIVPAAGDPATGPDQIDIGACLSEAARRVRESWNGVSEGPEEGGGVESQLQRVVELAALTRARGGAPDLSGQATALRIRLLDGLRRELLDLPPEEVADTTDPTEVLETLRSLEVVRTGLEEDWSRRFGLVLSGPRGMDVAAEIAHGLRSSCTSILFVAEVLRDGMYGDLNEKQRNQIEILYGSAVALTGMLTDISELSWRTEEPDGTPPEAFSLEDVADSVFDLLAPVAETRDVELQMDVQGRPARSGHLRALRHVLLNLTIQAVLHAREGRVVMKARDHHGEDVDFQIHVERPKSPAPHDGYRILRKSAEEGEYTFSGEALRLHVARELVRALGGDLEQRKEEDGALQFSFSIRLPPDGTAVDA